MEPLTIQDLLMLLGDRDVLIEQQRRLIAKLEEALKAKTNEQT